MSHIRKSNLGMALPAALAVSVFALYAPVSPVHAQQAGSQAQATPSQQQQQGEFRLIDAGSLMDADVQSKEGQTVGKLKYLMIDPSDGDLVLALVGRTGNYGEFVALPWDQIDLTTWQGNKSVSLKVAKADFDKASHYTIQDVGRLTTPIGQAQVYNLYGTVRDKGPQQSGKQQGQDQTEQGQQGQSQNQTAEGRQSQGQNQGQQAQGQSGAPYVFLGHEFVATIADPAVTLDNKLKGSEIFTGGQNPQKIGEIERLLIDPERGKVAFAVVGTSQHLGMGEQDTRIPLQALEWAGQGQYVLSQSRIEGMKKGDQSGKPAEQSPFSNVSSKDLDKIYQTYGVDPYWKG